jgi:hypothetical protein
LRDVNLLLTLSQYVLTASIRIGAFTFASHLPLLGNPSNTSTILYSFSFDLTLTELWLHSGATRGALAGSAMLFFTSSITLQTSNSVLISCLLRDFFFSSPPGFVNARILVPEAHRWLRDTARRFAA